jgi:hypothetical protein
MNYTTPTLYGVDFGVVPCTMCANILEALCSLQTWHTAKMLHGITTHKNFSHCCKMLTSCNININLCQGLKLNAAFIN